tara:strand:+ start:469 stop:888 length:420 start_codon:yes stop_codon:yes gene_type:complete
MGFHWPSHVGLDEFWTGDGQFADAFFFAQKVTLWQGDGIHENPRFYKYDWQIWTRDTPITASQRGSQALIQRELSPKLCFAAAMERIRTLHAAGEFMLIRSIGRKRIGPDAPWNASRVEPMRQACAYDDDSDPDFHGHR